MSAAAASITDNERLNLNKLIREMNTVDNTDYIRKAKQSGKIAKDVLVIEKLKRETQEWRLDDTERFIELCKNSCTFLYNNYTDIFNKLVKDELNLDIMKQFLWNLAMIENGELTQQEGSVIIGRLLKDLYLDSAVRRADRLDGARAPPPELEVKPITWREYKTRRADIVMSLGAATDNVEPHL
jgi:hypothetical protein